MAPWIFFAVALVVLLCALAILAAFMLSRQVNSENFTLLEKPLQAQEPERTQESQPLYPEAP